MIYPVRDKDLNVNMEEDNEDVVCHDDRVGDGGSGLENVCNSGNDDDVRHHTGDDDYDDYDDNDDGDDIVGRFDRMCREKTCLEDACLKLQLFERRLDWALRTQNSEEISPDVLTFFKKILKHSLTCDEVNCFVPYCCYLCQLIKIDKITGQSWGKMFSSVKRDLKRIEFHKYLEFQMKMADRSIIMDTDIQWPSGLVTPINHQTSTTPCDIDPRIKTKWKIVTIPDRFEEHHVINECPLMVDLMGTRYIPRPGTDFNIRCEYSSFGKYTCHASSRVIGRPFEIKMEQYFFLPRNHYLGKYLDDLKKLVNHHHQNLTHFLWVMTTEVDSRVTMAYLDRFRDKSLTDICGKMENLGQVCQVMIGFIKGVQFLHHKRLLFLNWQASALVYDSDSYVGKLHDFQYMLDFDSRNMSSDDDDDDDDEDLSFILYCLEPSCIPIELLKHCIGEFTEAYGLGSVMLQLISGRPLFHELRHEGRNKRIKAIYNMPSTPESLQKLISPHLDGILQENLKEKFLRIFSNLFGPHQSRMNLESLEDDLNCIINLDLQN